MLESAQPKLLIDIQVDFCGHGVASYQTADNMTYHILLD